MDLNQVIAELYEAGIDCGLECYQGRGITAWVVDQRGRRIETEFAITDSASLVHWLRVEGVRQAAARDMRRGEAHEILAELANSHRKPPKRVSYYDRSARLDAAARKERDETNQLDLLRGRSHPS